MGDECLNAEIISVGTELLLGQIVNTNEAFLSRELAKLGIDVYRRSVVGDNKERLINEIKGAFERCSLVVLTGGLGPTQDDLTREAAAEYFDLPLNIDKSAAQKLKGYFERRKSIMPHTNIRQAMVPDGAIVLENENGTAPGLIIEKNGKTAVLMPGPPKEMEPMYLKKVYPYLEKFSSSKIYSKILRFFGIGESSLEISVADLIEKNADPTIATYIDGTDVIIRLTTKSGCRENAMEKIMTVADEIKSRLKKYYYGEDNDTMADTVYRLLKLTNKTVSTAESCTGGMIGQTLTSVAGISEYYGFGFITYANEAKEKLICVKKSTLDEYGAVSSQTACEMALGALEKSGADLAVSVTGIAGPGGGTDEKPVGLVYIGFASKDGKCEAYKHIFGGNREEVRRRTVTAALNIIRLSLQEDI